MAENVITPAFRSTFVALLRPSAGRAKEDGTPGELKYTLRAAFPPNADLTALKAAAKQALVEKWGDKIPKVFRSPFRTYAELDKEFEGIGQDWTLITFSTKAKRKPGVVNGMIRDAEGRPTDILDEDEVYTGCWFKAVVRASAYEMAGNKGVSFYLQHAMKIRDDKPLGNKGVSIYLQHAMNIRDDKPLGSTRIPAALAFEGALEEGERDPFS